MAFTAWTAVVLAFAAFDPLGLVRAPMHAQGERTANGPTHVVTALLSARAGPAGPLARPAAARPDPAPVFTQVRFNPRTRRAVFAGRGQPDARIAILQAGRVIVYTRVREDRRWLAAATFTDIPDQLAFTIEQRDTLTGDLIVGGSINLHLPARYRRSISVHGEGADAGDDAFRLVAVKAETDSLGPAASRALEDLVADAAGPTEVTGQPVEVAGTWDWFEGANRSYQDEIVDRLRRGGGFGESDAQRRRDLNGFRDRETRDERDGDARAGDRDRWDRDRDGDERRSAAEERDPFPRGAEPVAASGGFIDWLTTARRSYETEIIPRLSGQVPRGILTRDELARERERLNRQAREARLREEAAQRAERERVEAERRRLEAAERRRAAEAEARRIAEERARLERLEAERARAAEAQRREEAERLAAERAERERLAAERRAEAERLAAERRTEEERRRREQAERDALARAERERLEAERRDAERERIAALEGARRAEEEARRRAEDERRRVEEERRRRMLAEAEARRREREAEQRRRLDELRERREAARQRLARRGDEREDRTDDTRIVIDRRRDDDSEPPLPTRQPTFREDYVRRDTTIRITGRDDGARGTFTSDRRGSLKDTPPAARRTARVESRRRARVQQYRRRIARHRVARCHEDAGRRITPPGVYIVKRGDSLWRIARRHYNRGSLYPVIHRANQSKIRRARLIYPCQRFRLPKLRFR